MTIKYESNYFDNQGNPIRVTISEEGHVGGLVQIDAFSAISMKSLDSMSSSLRTMVAKLRVFTDDLNGFPDLIDAEEREFEVRQYVGNELKFFGYLTSEDVVDDYFRKERFIEFDVLGPLAFLEDLAYVDSNGSPLIGYATILEIISNCVRRAFSSDSTPFNLITKCPYDYQTKNPFTGTTTSHDTGFFLESCGVEQDQWIDVDSGDSESCQNVLKNILFSLQLAITQLNGTTFIVFPFIYNNVTVEDKYERFYDSGGSPIPSFLATLFSAANIETDNGTNKDSFLHINENQTIQKTRGTQKLTIDFEYVPRNSVLDNPSFENGVNGGLMPFWDLLNGYSESTSLGYLRVLKYDTSDSDIQPEAAISQSNIFVDSSVDLKVTGSFRSNFADSLFFFVLELVSPQLPNPRYVSFRNPGEYRWVSESVPGLKEVVFIEGVENETLDFEVQFPRPPASGKITLYILPSRNIGSQNSATGKEIELYNIDLIVGESNNTGLRYTGVNNDSNSLRTDSDEVYISTGEDNIQANNLIELSSGFPVFSIKDTNLDDIYRDLGDVIVRNQLKILRRRSFFNGDVLGFLESRNLVLIPDASIEGFVQIEHTNGEDDNIVSLNLEEQLKSDINVTISKTELFANTITPTIES